MTFAKHASDRHTQTEIRRLRPAEPHPSQDLRRGHAGALALSLSRHDTRVPPATPARSSLTVKAATMLSYCAGHALPALLLGIVSWAIVEILAGLAAYAEAMYSPPAPSGPVPAETDATNMPRGTKPSLSLMTMQVNDGTVAYSNQAPARCPGGGASYRLSDRAQVICCTVVEPVPGARPASRHRGAAGS